jgi:hypothetical protein
MRAYPNVSGSLSDANDTASAYPEALADAFLSRDDHRARHPGQLRLAAKTSLLVDLAVAEHRVASAEVRPLQRDAQMVRVPSCLSLAERRGRFVMQYASSSSPLSHQMLWLGDSK